MNAETGFSQEGFDAVSRALERLYSGQEGIFYRTVIPYALGGKDPLDGIEVWKSEHGVPHWHYVTYGFTELYEKESDISQESGYGFELTFRLKRGAEEQPPAWPVNLLQKMCIRDRQKGALRSSRPGRTFRLPCGTPMPGIILTNMILTIRRPSGCRLRRKTRRAAAHGIIVILWR